MVFHTNVKVAWWHIQKRPVEDNSLIAIRSHKYDHDHDSNDRAEESGQAVPDEPKPSQEREQWIGDNVTDMVHID